MKTERDFVEVIAKAKFICALVLFVTVTLVVVLMSDRNSWTHLVAVSALCGAVLTIQVYATKIARAIQEWHDEL